MLTLTNQSVFLGNSKNVKIATDNEKLYTFANEDLIFSTTDARGFSRRPALGQITFLTTMQVSASLILDVRKNLLACCPNILVFQLANTRTKITARDLYAMVRNGKEH